ncbi:hypothetical protein N7537_005420 [Penicillium hordei]|uniref:Uncharacterized protein n=1 Tax=Penicillium hordei TaxID=40994 RepID=A0AAD6E6Z1_9EURO|nr:uncharacterized protein N7537_005420 [Penicillium hordei]KAJ5602464.1 hypothetical protein N7537_005420 [Penicillium hordei]
MSDDKPTLYEILSIFTAIPPPSHPIDPVSKALPQSSGAAFLNVGRLRLGIAMGAETATTLMETEGSAEEMGWIT